MDRRFTGEEAQRIFAAAAERQQRAARDSDRELTLADLEDAARAAGIDPSFVREAAHGVLYPHADDRHLKILGMGIERRHSIGLPGRMSDDEWARIVQRLRKITGERGLAAELGGSYEWSSHADKEKMPYHVLADVDDDGTRVIIERNKAQQTGGFLIASGVLLLVGIILAVLAAFVNPDALIAAGIIGSISVVLLAVAYATSRVTERKEVERFEQMFDAFRDAIEGEEPARTDVAPPRLERQEPDRNAGIVQDVDTPVDADTETTRRRRTRS